MKAATQTLSNRCKKTSTEVIATVVIETNVLRGVLCRGKSIEHVGTTIVVRKLIIQAGHNYVEYMDMENME